MKNKKAMEIHSIVIFLGVTLFAALIVGWLYYNWGQKADTSTKEQFDVITGDLDGDRVMNRDDKCCAAACNPMGLKVGDCPGTWCGCTEYQGYTDCKATECNLDYDHDGVLNYDLKNDPKKEKQIDQCCAPQCKPEPGQLVDMRCPGDRCGCAEGQINLPCDALIGTPCKPPEASGTP